MWIAGGSSSHPRKARCGGRATQKEASRGAQVTGKHGVALLKVRGELKRPAAVCKRPSVPYTPARNGLKPSNNRFITIATKTKIRLEAVLGATPRRLVQMLQKGGHLPTHTRCFHCKVGVLGKPRKAKPVNVARCTTARTTARDGSCDRRQCARCKGQTYPHHGSPVFSIGRGQSFVPLRLQAGILFCAVWGIPKCYVPLLIDGVGNKKLVDNVYTRWRSHLSLYVVYKQQSIVYGGSRSASVLDEVEVDEAIMRKSSIDDEQVEWQEYTGLKRRGDPKSLYLQKRDPKRSRSSRTMKGTAVPPPQSINEWTEIANCPVGDGRRVGENTLVHADGAPAYARKPHGTFVDQVSHSGKNKCFTKRVTHLLSSGQTYAAVGGTQSLDGWWKSPKKRLFGIPAVAQEAVDRVVRETQWQHWCGPDDRWEAAGNVLSWSSDSTSH